MRLRTDLLSYVHQKLTGLLGELTFQTNKMQTYQDAIEALLKESVMLPPELLTQIESFELAKKLKHDVFDCVYLAFALQERAKGIVTTDTDFERICRQAGLDYINPVPKHVLKRFAEQNR